MPHTLCHTLRTLRRWPILVVATVVSLGVAGAGAQGSTEPTKAPTASVSKSDQEIIDTLQLAYRWGYPLMAMATNNRET